MKLRMFFFLFCFLTIDLCSADHKRADQDLPKPIVTQSALCTLCKILQHLSVQQHIVLQRIITFGHEELQILSDSERDTYILLPQELKMILGFKDSFSYSETPPKITLSEFLSNQNQQISGIKNSRSTSSLVVVVSRPDSEGDWSDFEEIDTLLTEETDGVSIELP